MAEPRTYWLPWPISTNNLRAPVNGRLISTEAARRWHKAATEELWLQKPEAVKGPVTIRVQLKAPTRRDYDPDNKIKVLFDALVKNGIIEDDNDKIVLNHNVEVAQDWDENIPCGALVTVRRHGPDMGGDTTEDAA